MTNKYTRHNPNESSQYIFRNKTQRLQRNEFRLLIETLLILFIGTGLAILCNYASKSFELNELFTNSIAELIDGLLILFSALTTLFFLLVILISLILSVILIMSGLWRLIRLYTQTKKSKISRFWRK